MQREEFKRVIDDSNSMEPSIKEPWLPFRSREDFEFAEIAHDVAMNRSQVDDLLMLFHRCQQDPGKVTFRNYSDLRQSWKDSSKLLTDVSASLDHTPDHPPSSRGLNSSKGTRYTTHTEMSNDNLRPGPVRCGGGFWITS